MSEKTLEDSLYQHFPLSQAMEVNVVEVSSDKVILRAPIAPNINHIGTVFGGSAVTLAILAAWTLVHHRLNEEGLECSIVIQKNDMNYQHPIQGDFEATAKFTDPNRWSMFTKTLYRKGRARINLTSIIDNSQHAAGIFHGDFVATLISSNSSTSE